MRFSQRVRTMNISDLKRLIDEASLEVERREAFFNSVPAKKLKDLTLSFQTRDLLYRQIADKSGNKNSLTVREMTVQDLFQFFVEDDWSRINYLNGKAYSEVHDALDTLGLPLESYYGSLTMESKL